MSDLKPKGIEIELGDQTYRLFFTLNVIDDIQDHFDKSVFDMIEIMKDEKNKYKNTAQILTFLINESIEIENEKGGERPLLDVKAVKRRITFKNYGYITEKILKAFSASASKSDNEADNEIDPQTTEQ